MLGWGDPPHGHVWLQMKYLCCKTSIEAAVFAVDVAVVAVVVVTAGGGGIFTRFSSQASP